MVKLIKANLRKDRTILIVFVLIIIFSTFLMHTGLLASNYKQLYDDYAEQTNLCDYILFTNESTDAVDETLGKADFVESYKTTDTVLLSSFTYTTSKSSKQSKATDWVFLDVNDLNGCSEIEFAERDESVAGRKIYLNIYVAYSNGLCAGDKIYIDTKLGKYEYTIAGIYQHLFMGNSYSYLSAMLDSESFAELNEAKGALVNEPDNTEWEQMTTVHIKDGCDPYECLMDTKQKLAGDYGVFCNGYTADEAKSVYVAVVNILAVFMAAFAVLIMIICVIIIIFTISNNISRDIINIGALKAVGHTVGQIRTALAAEYLFLGAAGSVVGIVLSYLLYPVLEYVYVRQMCGIIWKNEFFPAISFGVALGVAALIVVTAFAATAKVKKLAPATALRFGLNSNSFKKNHLPLDRTSGRLNVLLALKSTLQSKGQNVIVFIIIMAVSFMTMCSAVLFYNTTADISSLQRMIMGDVADAHLYVKDGSSEAVSKTIDEVCTIDGVKHAYGITILFAYVDGKEIDLVYTTDPACLSCEIYDGKMFKEENEAVLGSTLADKIGAGVGDEVEVTYGGKKRRFLVTGLQQSAMNNRIYIHENAARELGVKITYDSVRVTVNDASEDRVDEVIRKAQEICGGNITSTDNQYRFQHSEENTPVVAIGVIVMIQMLLNVVVVLLVIRLLLKTVFIKREKEFGIKKAIGFTSGQLRIQLSLSLMPVTVIAAVLGSVLGYFMINPVFTLVLGGYGLKKADLITKPVLMLPTALAVIVFVFILSYVMSKKMKKVSAYRLISE